MRTIENIQAQTFQDWELLLVDDGSTDNSRAIMERYESEQIRCFYCPQNLGPANARNIGLEHATGRYIAYQDADDLWEREKLSRQLSFMQEHQYAFTFTSYEFADADGKRNGRVVHAPRRVTYPEFLKSSTLASNTLMFDRTVVKDEWLRMPLGVAREDAATWMQVLKQGIDAYGLDEVLVLYCRHESAYSGNKVKAVLGKWQLYYKIEKFSLIKSIYYVIVNTWAAVRRRI